MTFLTLPAAQSRPTSGPPQDTTTRSLTDERRMARTTDIGLRREPQPPIPMVIPSRNSATTSVSVVRLSPISRSFAPFPISRPPFLQVGTTCLTGDVGQIQLEVEALLEPVAATGSTASMTLTDSFARR